MEGEENNWEWDEGGERGIEELLRTEVTVVVGALVNARISLVHLGQFRAGNRKFSYREPLLSPFISFFGLLMSLSEQHVASLYAIFYFFADQRFFRSFDRFRLSLIHGRLMNFLFGYRSRILGIIRMFPRHR